VDIWGSFTADDGVSVCIQSKDGGKGLYRRDGDAGDEGL
jgi:hypothetical protein